MYEEFICKFCAYNCDKSKSYIIMSNLNKNTIKEREHTETEGKNELKHMKKTTLDSLNNENSDKEIDKLLLLLLFYIFMCFDHFFL